MDEKTFTTIVCLGILLGIPAAIIFINWLVHRNKYITDESCGYDNDLSEPYHYGADD